MGSIAVLVERDAGEESRQLAQQAMRLAADSGHVVQFEPSLEDTSDVDAILLMTDPSSLPRGGDYPRRIVAVGRDGAGKWLLATIGDHAKPTASVSIEMPFPGRILAALEEVMAGAVPDTPRQIDLLAAKLSDALGRVLSLDTERGLLLDRLAEVTGDRDAAYRRIEHLEQQLKSLRAATAERPSASRSAVIGAIGVVVSALIGASAVAYTAHSSAEAQVRVAEIAAAQSSAAASLADLDALAIALAECQASSPDPAP